MKPKQAGTRKRRVVEKELAASPQVVYNLEKMAFHARVGTMPSAQYLRLVTKAGKCESVSQIEDLIRGSIDKVGSLTYPKGRLGSLLLLNKVLSRVV